MEINPLSVRVLGAALLGLVSCTGRIGDSLSQGGGPTGGVSEIPPSPPPATTASTPPRLPPPMGESERPETCPSATFQRARRVSLGEYERAASGLLGLAPGLGSGFAPEPSVHGFDNQATALSISSGNLEEFAAAAEIAAQAADLRTLAPCDADSAPDDCATSFMARFARRAYGRPITDGELMDLSAIYRQGAEDGYERGIRGVIEAVLLSPYFLYRTEVGTTVEGAVTARLEATEVANAVAFALTGERPDDLLAARAMTDRAFRTPGVLRDESARLLQKPESRQHLARFLRGWLGVRDVRAVNKIPAMFPRFTPQLKADLDTELDLFLDHVLNENRGTLEALLGSSVTFASAAMLETIYAHDYASPPALPAPGEFAKIELNTKMRRGVISLGGWLAAHSPVHRSSPVDRGLAIRTRFFCQTLLPPPPGVIASAPSGGDGVMTTRQKFEKHTSDATCKSCHRLMDPIGFGLEMMDALGAFRNFEAGLPIDSSGALEGTDVDGAFSGPAELADRLLASRQVRDCFVVQMFRYVEGRDEQRPADTCAISELQRFFATPGTTIGELATEMIAHPRFIRRRVER